MYYPPRHYKIGAIPQEIVVGDFIWTLEGASVEFVAAVIENKDDLARWGLLEPSIAVTGNHPFRMLDHYDRHRLWIEEGIDTTIYKQSQLESQGIHPLTSNERAELAWALSEARTRVPSVVRNAPYRVSATMQFPSREESWRIYFVDGSSLVFECVEFPFRPNTRAIGEQAASSNH